MCVTTTTAPGAASQPQAPNLERAPTTAPADARPLVDALVDETFDHVNNAGLVDLFRDAQAKERAIAIILQLRVHMEARHGNNVRIKTEDLLELYLKELGFAKLVSARRCDGSLSTLWDLCGSVESALEEILENTNLQDRNYYKTLNKAVSSVIRACHGVRKVTNDDSHVTEFLSDADRYELCGYFKVLGAALPSIAAEVYRPTPVIQEGSTLSSPLIDPSAMTHQQPLQILLSTVELQSPTAAAPINHTPVTTFSSSNDIATRLNFAAAVTTTNATCRSPNESKAATSPLSQGSLTPVYKAIVPTQAALGAVRSFKFYYDRPSEVSKETDRTRMAMFPRMISHVKDVDKAKLCSYSLGHDPKCRLSHSYLEVMRYNPLFKLIVCQQCRHYYGRDVVENNNCGGCHVDVGIRLLDALLKTKKERCVDAESCRNTNCHKSHSFEEMCWYNPWYKTQLCNPTRCCGNAMECPYAHDGELRKWKTEKDYVGKNVPMLFIERTHKPLADALEALRYARAHDL